jgi:hypothetical protein
MLQVAWHRALLLQLLDVSCYRWRLVEGVSLANRDARTQWAAYKKTHRTCGLNFQRPTGCLIIDEGEGSHLGGGDPVVGLPPSGRTKGNLFSESLLQVCVVPADVESS